MGKLRTVQNISTGITNMTRRVGDPWMSSWIINFSKFARSSPRDKYGHFLQKYNILPGQYARTFYLNTL